MVSAEFIEDFHCELTSMVCASHVQHVTALHLSYSLNSPDCRLSNVLDGEEHLPHVAAEIKHHQEEVAFPAGSRRCDWPTEVTVDQLQHIGSTK